MLLNKEESPKRYETTVATAKEFKEHLASVPDNFIWQTDCDGDRDSVHFYDEETGESYTLYYPERY